jgi:hypothetical protein
VRKLRTLLNASCTTELGEFFADRTLELERKIESTKTAAKEMRTNLIEREAKLSWQQEWQHLLDEEVRLDEELQKWMADHRDIEVDDDDSGGEPLSPVQSEAQRLSESKCIRVGDVYSAYLQRSYEFELQKKKSKNELSVLRSAITSFKMSAPGLSRSKAKSVARAGLEHITARLQTEKDIISTQLSLAEKESVVNPNSFTLTDTFDSSNIRDHGVNEEEDELDEGLNSPQLEETSEFLLQSPMNRHKLRRRVEMIRAKSSFELDKVGGALCSDVDLIKRLTDEFAALFAIYDADAASLTRGWKDVCRECGVESSTHDELGGWLRDDHLAYLQAVRMSVSMRSVARSGHSTTESVDIDPANTATLSGNVYDTISALILRMSGGKRKPTRTDVLSHHKYTVARRFFLQRMSARKAQWKRESSAHIESSRLQFSAAREETDDRRRREYEREAHELVRRVTHARLEKQRAQKAVEDAVLDAIRASEAESEENLAGAVRAKRAAHFVAVKQALEAYKEEERVLQERIESVREAVALAEAERRAASLAEGHERVQFREQLLVEKAKKAKDLEAEARNLETEKAALLEKLVASVPYRERIEEIATTADASRITAHTEASATSAALSSAYAAYLKAVKCDSEESALLATHDNLDLATAAKVAASQAKQTAGSNEPVVAAAQRASSDNLLTLANRRIKEQGLFPKHGFTDRQVTGDKRFRYLAGVYASGVQHTSAARTAFNALPAKQSAQSMISQ